MKYLKHIIFGTLMGFMVSLDLFLVSHWPRPWVLLLGFFVTTLFLLSFYFYVKKTRHWKEPIGFLTLVLFVAQIGLVIILEHFWIRIGVIILSGMLFAILYGAGVTPGDTLSSLQKPYRRFVMATWVFGIFGIAASFFALQLFIPFSWLFVLLLLGGGVIMGYVASFVWRMYFPRPQKAFVFWMILLGFVSMQLLWALHFLPLGYLTLGLLVTWAWYLLILFARFHWDETGIQWKKQFPFLLTNSVVLIILVLFFIRWT